MMKKRAALLVSSIFVFMVAFALLNCSDDSSDSPTGSTGGSDIDEMVRNNADGLNFIFEFDGDMDTDYPPGTEVAGIDLSFFSPPAAHAKDLFNGCVFFYNLNPSTSFKGAYWTGKRELVFMLGKADHGELYGEINGNSCSNSNKFRTKVGMVIPSQPFSFNHAGAGTLDTLPKFRYRISF